jgi:hypothetical protein
MAFAMVITSLAQVTPAWLTAVLNKSGAITTERVTTFAAQEGGGHWSENARILAPFEALDN